VESCQAVLLHGPVVSATRAGAIALGRTYWAVVERSTRRLVRAVVHPDGRCELRALGLGPPLLRFDAPRIALAADRVTCTYGIAGGLLARRRSGTIAFEQRAGDTVQLSSSIEGFFPALAARPGMPAWTGVLYAHVQSRIHVAISRRYFGRLVEEAAWRV